MRIALAACAALALAGCYSDKPTPMAAGECRALDGDTLRCGDERIRLIGIDAPELKGCRPGRQCVSGDPVYAREVLAVVASGPLRIERKGEDHYGRTLAHVSYSGGGNAACTMIAAHAAAYVAKWDNLPQGRVALECGL